MRNEEMWARWKEMKCAPNYEKPPSVPLRQRKRDAKAEGKLVGQCSNLVASKDGKINDRRNGAQMREYYRMPSEDIDSLGNSLNIHQVDCKSLGEYLYAFLCDIDPE